MNPKIEVFNEDTSIFRGKLLNLPFKKSIIIEKSIELFGDEDPCIIHQSYVIRILVDAFLNVFDDNVLDAKAHPELFSWLDFNDAHILRIERR